MLSMHALLPVTVNSGAQPDKSLAAQTRKCATVHLKPCRALPAASEGTKYESVVDSSPVGTRSMAPAASHLPKTSESQHKGTKRAVPVDEGSTYTSGGRSGTRQRGRSVFSFGRWQSHRDTSRYFRHVSGILRSSTFKTLSMPLAFLTTNAALIAGYEWCVENHHLPAHFPTLQLDEAPFSVTSFALSLLLVFRTDASYARWNEALSAWSEVRNTAKEITRFSVIWIKTPELQSVLRRWTMAFPRTLQVYLREHGDLRSELATVLWPYELDRLEDAHSYPHYVLHVLTEVVECAGLSEIREDMLLTSIGNFSDAIGVCEKIIRYPIPLSYTRHTSRFMIIWLSLLPFSLWHGCKWAAVPVTGCIAFLLLGIEEIGVQCEEPFGLLPLEDICADIERDIGAIIRSKDSVREVVSHATLHQVRDDTTAAATASVLAAAVATCCSNSSASSSGKACLGEGHDGGGSAGGSDSAARKIGGVRVWGDDQDMCASNGFGSMPSSNAMGGGNQVEVHASDSCGHDNSSRVCGGSSSSSHHQNCGNGSSTSASGSTRQGSGGCTGSIIRPADTGNFDACGVPTHTWHSNGTMARSLERGGSSKVGEPGSGEVLDVESRLCTSRTQDVECAQCPSLNIPVQSRSSTFACRR